MEVVLGGNTPLSYITIMTHSKTLRKPKSSEIAHTGVIHGVLLVLRASHSHPNTPCLLIRVTPLFAFSDFLDKCLDTSFPFLNHAISFIEGYLTITHNYF